MKVTMKGAGVEDFPEHLARSLIERGLAEPAPEEAASPPSLAMEREELAAIAKKRAVEVYEVDDKAEILAKIEAAPAPSKVEAAKGGASRKSGRKG